jgi:DNA-binding response OmpR family regulator
MQPMKTISILLVSSDLMATSRLASIGREAGADVETLATVAGTPRAAGYDVVLLDLQSLPGEPGGNVARGKALGGDGAKVIAFGPHVWKDRLDAAVAAGADDAVSRGEVMGGLPMLLARWCGGA